MDILDGKMICNHFTGFLDETDEDETSWQNYVSFQVKMFVKYDIKAGSVSPGVRMQCKESPEKKGILNWFSIFFLSFITEFYKPV